MNAKRRWYWDDVSPYLMIAPAIVAMIFVHIIPSINAIWMSFFDIILTKPGTPFIGLGNFMEFFRKETNLRVLGNTALWTVLSVFFGMALSLLIATQLNKPILGRGILRSLYLAPWVTPPIVIGTIWKLILNKDLSPINSALMYMGIIKIPMSFLADPTTYFGVVSKPMLVLIIINIWSFMPFAIVMFLSALQTIPSELYEAATVDGASRIRQFFKITFPLLIPVMETILLLQLVWQFNSFNLSFLVTHGGPVNTTELMAVRVYTEAVSNYRYGYSAAISVIMVLVIAVPAVFYIKKVLREELSETAL